MSKTIQCRLSDSEFEAIEKVVPLFNIGEYAERQNLREIINMRYTYGQVTVSDIVRTAINNQVNVIQAEILARNTKRQQLGTKRNTRTIAGKRSTNSSRSTKKRNTQRRRS